MDLKEYPAGVRTGLPVGLGYFSVSFGFGAMAVSKGLSVWDATLISASNLTSAGQFAGLGVIVENSGLWLMILTQLIINSRYALMSLALSQRMGQKIGLLPRLCIAFINTDEVFALAMAREKELTVPFLYGLGLLPIIGWVSGTLFGALAGSILPGSIRTALGVMLYGMFIAIVIPPAKKERSVAAAALLALVFSCLFAWVPVLQKAPTGTQVNALLQISASITAARIFRSVFAGGTTMAMNMP